MQFGFLLRPGRALELELALGGFGELKPRQVGFAAGDLPELPGGLRHGEWQGVPARLTRLTQGLRPDEPRRKPREPFVEQRAHGTGQTATQALAHALDGGLEAFGDQCVGRGADVGTQRIRTSRSECRFVEIESQYANRLMALITM
jgi:hypothetical protein